MARGEAEGVALSAGRAVAPKEAVLAFETSATEVRVTVTAPAPWALRWLGAAGRPSGLAVAAREDTLPGTRREISSPESAAERGSATVLALGVVGAVLVCCQGRGGRGSGPCRTSGPSLGRPGVARGSGGAAAGRGARGGLQAGRRDSQGQWGRREGVLTGRRREHQRARVRGPA